MENNKSKSGPPSEKTAMEDLFGYMNPITILQFVSATQDEERVSIVYNALSHLQLFDPTALQHAKSAVDAARHRDKGSAECTRRPEPNLPEALAWFTKCIAAAPYVGQADPHSADLALDFASRSAVLYKMAKYDACLSDVEQACRMGYPDKLRYQLHMRRGDCLHIMGRTGEAKKSFEDAVTALPLAVDLHPTEQKRQLCYARVQLARIDKGYARGEGYRGRRERPPPRLADGGNPAVPAMARCVEICRSEQWGRHVRATRDIKPGEVLLVEDPYVSILWSTNYQTHCYHCLRRFDALIPCKTCPLVMFCSDTCRETSWATSHASECPLLFLLNQVPRYHFLLTPLRVILVAVKHYRGLRGLHDHVKRMEAMEDVGRAQGTNHVERTEETTNGDRATQGTNHVERTEETTNGDRATEGTNQVERTEETTNGDRATEGTNHVERTDETTIGDRATQGTNHVERTDETTNGDRATQGTNHVERTDETTNGDRATQRTNHVERTEETTNGDRATEGTDNVARMKVTNGIKRSETVNSNCTEEGTDASRQIEATNNIQPQEAEDDCRQTEATNGVRLTKSRKNRKRTKANSVRPTELANDVRPIEETNNARTTGEATNASKQTEATNASRQTEATNASRQTEGTDASRQTKATNASRQSEGTNASRQTEDTDASRQTKATNASRQTEDTDASRQTEATNASRQTEATDASKQTEATNASRQTEATDASRQTEGTDASRQTEATNASRQTEGTDASKQTEATNDVTRIAGFNTEGRYLSSDYTAVHHMLTNSRQLTVHKLWPYALNAALLVKCLESWGELRRDLESCELKRFLGGLLLRYEMIVASNGYPIDEYSTVADPAQTARPRGVGGAVYPTAGLLNHACDANTCGYQRGDRVVVTATAPIAKGEQVFIDYVGQRLSIHAPPSTRRSYLEEQFHFTCHCPLCTRGLPTADLADLLLSWQCNRCHARLLGGGGSRGSQQVAVTCHRCKERTTTERLRGQADERVARFKGLARRARGSGDVTAELGQVLTETCGGGEAAPQLVYVFKTLLRMNCTQAGKYFLED